MWARGRCWIEEDNMGKKEEYDLRLSNQEILWVARKRNLLNLKGERENTGFLELQ